MMKKRVEGVCFYSFHLWDRLIWFGANGRIARKTAGFYLTTSVDDVPLSVMKTTDETIRADTPVSFFTVHVPWTTYEKDRTMKVKY